ncbi:hypothetical protein ACQPU1_09555 [Clostridium paraputrificum]|uniref:hypothetical protein n=1 Tax=Clostridium paraputrificum TaxID=29363 RepID=UPI003D348FF2
MKNIINILKYNGYNSKGFVKSLLGICILFIVMKLIKIPIIYSTGIEIAVASTILGINFIISIVRTSLQLSKEEGRLLFLAPIKGREYIIAKYLEFIINQVVTGGVVVLATQFLGAPANILSISIMSISAIIVGTTTLYVIITSFIVITASYTSSTPICIIGTIIATITFISIGDIITFMINKFVPYVYLIINDTIEIGIVSLAVSLLGILILIIVSIKHFDNKFEIS